MGYAERTGLPAYTSNTLTTLDRLNAELNTIRQAQLAYDREEAELGVACIGAPIRDAEGKLVAGLSISAPADRHKPGWAEAQKQAAAQTGAALGTLRMPDAAAHSKACRAQAFLAMWRHDEPVRPDPLSDRRLADDGVGLLPGQSASAAGPAGGLLVCSW
jgi:hypothetical protein